MSDSLRSRDPIARLAERQHWISPHAEVGLQKSIAQAVHAVGGDTLRRALHGDWLHEPLHAVLTDVPIGAWTGTVAFDAIAALTGSSSLDNAADATLVLGLVGAVGAAVTGLNDWSEIKPAAPRRIGLVHASLNIAATGFFAVSGIARINKARSAGRALAAIGFLLVSASAHLGGSLVYEHRIGVAPDPPVGNVTEHLQA